MKKSRFCDTIEGNKCPKCYKGTLMATNISIVYKCNLCGIDVVYEPAVLEKNDVETLKDCSK